MFAKLASGFALGFAGGILASPHCLGMCGAFPLYLAQSSRKGSALLRQLLFLFGKSFTYIFLGTLAASFQAILLKNTSMTRFSSFIPVFFAVVTVLFGLSMIGVKLPLRLPKTDRAENSAFVRMLGGMASAPYPIGAFILGMGVGFMPCPLPMGMLSIAAARHDVLYGMALMLGMGFGTYPALLAVGLFGVKIDRKFSVIGMRVAGFVVLALGLLMAGRSAAGMMRHHTTQAIPSCCEEQMR